MAIRIGLSGKAGVGKTTIASELCRRYGFIKLAFADALKQSIMFLDPLTFLEPKESYRTKMQMFGSACRRIFGEDVWVDKLLVYVDLLEDMPIVVDDVRMLNEYEALRDNDFVLIRIERSPKLRERAGYNVRDNHISEVELDGLPVRAWDLVVQNNWDYPFGEAVETIASFLNLRSQSDEEE